MKKNRMTQPKMKVDLRQNLEPDWNSSTTKKAAWRGSPWRALVGMFRSR